MTKKSFNTSILALVVVFGSGCSLQAFKDRNPQMSDLKIDNDEIRVQVPMPPPKPKRLAYRAEAASLWDQGGAGFFSDYRAKTVGDLLTVNIEISDKASFSNASNTKRGGKSTVSKPTLFGYEKKLDEFLPGVATEDIPTGDFGDLESTTSTNGSGTIERDETIELRIAAMVIQELPNGSLVIAGRQEVKVNNELRELRIAGIIRPQDIDRNNTIAYDKVAEARIVYGGRGQLSRTQRINYGGTIADIILPY